MIPITPHLANECLNEISDNRIYAWPKVNDKYLHSKVFAIVVQINGKKRGLISTEQDLDEKKLISTNISDKIQFYPVSKYVNYPSNNDAKCIERI